MVRLCGLPAAFPGLGAQTLCTQLRSVEAGITCVPVAGKALRKRVAGRRLQSQPRVPEQQLTAGTGTQITPRYLLGNTTREAFSISE